MENSPLRKLPPELRDMVYGFALTVPHSICLRSVGNHWWVRRDHQSSLVDAASLGHTCKQIRQETHGLLLAVNEINFVVSYPGSPLYATILPKIPFLIRPAAMSTHVRLMLDPIMSPIVNPKTRSKLERNLLPFLENLRRQGEELEWNVSVKVGLAFGDQWPLHLPSLILPLGGTATEMRDALHSLDKNVETLKVAKEVEFAKDLLGRYISEVYEPAS